MAKEVVRLEDVWKIYKMDGTSVEALKGISLKILEKEFVGIIGPSGSGKSTAMDIIGLLDVPTKGKAFLKGKDVSRLSDDRLAELRGKSIGFIFQMFNLIRTLTAFENVMLPVMFQAVSKEKQKRAIELLKMVGLGERIYHRPTQLSGGEQQRIAIARALINDPDLILADEPTGNLDSKTGNQIMEIFKRLHEGGKTVVVITHDPNIAKYTKRVINLVDGKIVHDRKIAEKFAWRAGRENKF